MKLHFFLNQNVLWSRSTTLGYKTKYGSAKVSIRSLQLLSTSSKSSNSSSHKRKRCNPQKIGLHHFPTFLLPYYYGAFHDRFLILDRGAAYYVVVSLKDAGKNVLESTSFKTRESSWIYYSGQKWRIGNWRLVVKCGYEMRKVVLYTIS